MSRIRYRDHAGGRTRNSLRAAKANLGKLGEVTEVRGYRYTSLRTAGGWPFRGQWEAVLVRGPRGSMRFESVLWGYSGEGPRGLSQILQACGLAKHAADTVAFNTERGTEDGIDFSIKFPVPIQVNPDVIKVW